MGKNKNTEKYSIMRNRTLIHHSALSLKEKSEKI